MVIEVLEKKSRGRNCCCEMKCFGADSCSVIGDGVGNTAVVCCLAPTSLEESMRSSYSLLE